MLLTANATTMVLTAPSMPASVVVGGVTYYSFFYGGTRRVLTVYVYAQMCAISTRACVRAYVRVVQKP
jgi:hypothetical protein